MNMIRRGKLCRKCLNLVDATPATLIGTAFQLMGETAVEEVSNSNLKTNLVYDLLVSFLLVVKKPKINNLSQDFKLPLLGNPPSVSRFFKVIGYTVTLIDIVSYFERGD